MAQLCQNPRIGQSNARNCGVIVARTQGKVHDSPRGGSEGAPGAAGGPRSRLGPNLSVRVGGLLFSLLPLLPSCLFVRPQRNTHYGPFHRHTNDVFLACFVACLLLSSPTHLRPFLSLLACFLSSPFLACFSFPCPRLVGRIGAPVGVSTPTLRRKIANHPGQN